MDMAWLSEFLVMDHSIQACSSLFSDTIFVFDSENKYRRSKFELETNFFELFWNALSENLSKNRAELWTSEKTSRDQEKTRVRLLNDPMLSFNSSKVGPFNSVVAKGTQTYEA